MKKSICAFRLQHGKSMIIFIERRSGKLYCYKLLMVKQIIGNMKYKKGTMDCIHKGNRYVYGYNF